MLPFYPQETRYSCVPACLRMVMAHWGIMVDESSLRACCQTDQFGTTAQATVACARQHGCQASESTGATWDELADYLEQGIHPILYINLFPIDTLWVLHAVVVEAVVGEAITLLDPLVGRRNVPKAALTQAWQMNRNRIIIITL